MPPRVSNPSTVLVVDDNRDLLQVISFGIEKIGYEVVSAETGDEAIELIRTGGKPDIVLTDGVMPGDAQGWDLARYVKRLRPDTPVVLMSGYIAEAQVRMSKTPQIDSFLPKPVSLSELLSVLNELLEARGVRAVPAFGQASVA